MDYDRLASDYAATHMPLAVYRPETLESELQRYHPIARLIEWMAAGFADVRR